MNTKLILALIIVTGLFLRWHNLSPFKIYPDAYQNLLVANNISIYHSVLGFLGPQGMLYPDYFMWTRPVYALLIVLTNFATHDMTFAAQMIAILAGVAAIPLAFMFIKKAFDTYGTPDTFGLIGATLLALSFNHTVWSGFIMTETTGVLFLLLFLTLFFKVLKTKSALTSDFITGVLFGCALLTRYEYALLLPIILLVFRKSVKHFRRLLMITSGVLFIVAFSVITLFPLQSLFSAVSYEMQDLIKLVGIVAGVCLLIFFLIKTIFKRYQKFLITNLPQILVGLLWIVTVLIFIEARAVRDFIRHDFLLTLFSLFGLTLMLYKKELRDYAIFVLVSVGCLGLLYYHTNPDMERYMTHLIPFLLLPASYGVVMSLRGGTTKQSQRLPRSLWSLAMTKYVVITLLLAFQIIISYRGLHPSQDASWFRTSYEEQAARTVGKEIPPHSWLLVSQPEPYFYNLHITTHSIADTAPFIFIENGTDDQKIIIVEDMGMHDVFPHFTKFLETELKSFEKKRFFVRENYHTEGMTQKETYPVVMYEITLGQLRTAIKSSDF